MTKSKNSKSESPITNLLNQISESEYRRNEIKMVIAAKIEDGINSKGLTRKELLTILGKDTPSIITRWLSGTHNFTCETLYDIENALDIKLIDTSPVIKKPKVVNLEVKLRGDYGFIQDYSRNSASSSGNLLYKIESKRLA